MPDEQARESAEAGESAGVSGEPSGDAELAVPESTDAPVTHSADVEDVPVSETPGAGAKKPGGVPIWAVLLAAIVPAAIVGGALWFLLGGGTDAEDRLTSSSANLLHAFTASGGSTSIRHEGVKPPGYPDDIPIYEGAKTISSVFQVSGEDAGYIVLSDTADSREDVAISVQEQFAQDPWHIDGVQDGAESSLVQFSRIDDANTAGVVLLTPSTDGSRTTIITSVQVTGGATDFEPEPFVPGESRSTPPDFPEEIPVYEGAIVIESAFQKDAGATSFGASYIVEASADDVLDFYRSGLEDKSLTVEDGDPSASMLEDAQSVRFSNEELTLNGEITVGKFDKDDKYTRIDVQAGDER